MMDPSNIKGLMEDKYQKLGNKSYLVNYYVFDALGVTLMTWLVNKLQHYVEQTIMNPIVY